MATTVRRFYLDTGTVKLFVEREKRGGSIKTVTEIRNADTSREVKIPLGKFTDDESLKSYIEDMKGKRGVEG